MTPTTLAETILRDVKRYSLTQLGPVEGGQWLHYPDVLDALTTAIDPAIAERAGEEIESLRLWNRDDAADLITALLAQNAALRAERDEYADAFKVDNAALGVALLRAEAAEAERDALRAERDEALTFLDNVVSKAPEPLKALGKYLAGKLDEDEWPTAEQYLNAAAKACADRSEAAEAQIAALTARVEGLTGAGKALIGVLDAEDEEGDFLIEAHGSKSILMRYAAAKKAMRATLSATTEERK